MRMKMEHMQADYFCDDFDLVESELDELPTNVNVELNKTLEDAIYEIEALNSELPAEQTEQLLGLCKNTVIETIVGQFGLASIILNARDGGNVTTVHNFENGITSTDADKARYEHMNDYDRKSSNYDKVGDKSFPKKRKEDFQNHNVVIDGYTGKPLAKDHTTHLDHIVSAKEIETNPALNLFTTPEKRAEIATQEMNLTYTDSRLNKSKGDNKLLEWEEKVDIKTGQKNADKYDVDRQLAEEKDKAARKKIGSDTAKLAVIKYTKELLSTGAKDAAKACAYTVIGFAIRDLTQTIFNQLHITFNQKKNENLKQVFIRFKDAIMQDLSKIKSDWKGLLETGVDAAVTSFLSNIVVFVINLIATTLKKLVSMIRAGFVSLCQAVKLLVHPPNDMPQNEIGYQALKIITAGLIGALSLGLSAAIEKLLQSIPGLQPIMVFPIPIQGQTVGDVIATVLSALAGGILTTLALYFMDGIHCSKKKLGITFKLVSLSGAMPQYALLETYNDIEEGYGSVACQMIDSDRKFNAAIAQTKESVDENIARSNESQNEFLNMLKANLED